MAFKVKLPTLFLGASYKKSFKWYVQDERGNNTPVDLSGLDGRIQLKDEPDGTILADWSTDNGLLAFSDTNRISIALPRAETDKYDFQEARWDLVVWPRGNIEEAELVMYGTVPAERVITDIA